MSTSATGIWIIIAVTVTGLAIFLGSVVLGRTRPRRRHAHGDRLQGAVQGGMHVGPPQRRTATRRAGRAPGVPRPGTRSTRARSPSLSAWNPGTPGGTRGARWICNTEPATVGQAGRPGPGPDEGQAR